MTLEEKRQWSIKFLLEIVSIVVIFGSIYGSWSIQNYKVTRLETSFDKHCTDGTKESKEVSDRLLRINVTQAVIQKDVSSIKENVNEIKNRMVD